MILNVAYSSDNNYVKQLACSILSLLENNKGFEWINIYIIDNGINNVNKEKIKEMTRKFNCKLIYLNFKEICKDLKTDNTFPISSFGRIFLSRIKELNQILYLDCDSLITGSFEKLWKVDIDDYYIAGVQDDVFSFYKESIGLDKNFRYINAGFIMINLKKWRQDNIEKQMLDFIKKYNGSVPHHDQGTINAICKDKILILPPKYNLQSPMLSYTSEQIKKIDNMNIYYNEDELEEARNKPIFIHFTNGLYNRPWNKSCTHPMKDIYVEYLNKTPWKGQIDNKELCRNARIVKKLYEILPFNIYCFIMQLINKRKNRILGRERK